MTVQAQKRGFSLIEINLAIFLVAMGMLTLFSLFPSGMKQIETAHESTQEALFGDYVLNTMRAEALQIQDGTVWTNLTEFQAAVVVGLTNVVVQSSVSDPLQFPDGSGLHMRYILNVSDAGSGLRSATLWCRSGQYGDNDPNAFKASAAKFYTEFFYSGMP
ncbi:MAG TPA: hypothetical protein DCS43_02080 [Verrucomicrobia bacterium]|nr:hypothetical protein [Verrucomicrobiota bacterium]